MGLRLESCTVDLKRRRVERAGMVSTLTPKEADLLSYLVEHTNEIVSREDLLRDVWGYAEGVNSRAPDTAIRTLRKKVETDPAQPSHILSEYGEGYRYVGVSDDSARLAPVTSENAPVRRTNCAPSGQPFFGREEVLAALETHFVGATRLVSLLGGPGLGKTTTARHYVESLLDRENRFQELWFCELTSARSADDIVATLASTLELEVDSGLDAEALTLQVGSALAARRPLLIVLDNFEHLSSLAVETVGTWLSVAPDLRFLVTSRERLRLREEVAIELAPLDADTGAALFRACASASGASLTSGDTEAILGLVNELDGIPLALTLAASRTRLMGVEGVRNRLQSGLGVLTSSLRDASTRHRTLNAAIDWSWGLLTPTEQLAFAQLGVFRGGFRLEEAEGVLSLTGDEPVWVVLESLVDKGLVHLSDPTEPRFDLFASLRTYALERLEAQGPRDALWLRHAKVIAACARPLAESLRDQGPHAGAEAYRALQQNMAAGLEHALQLGEATLAVQLSLCLVPTWTLGGASIPVRVGRLESVLVLLDAVDPALRADFLVTYGELLGHAHRMADARDRLEQGVACARSCTANVPEVRGLLALALIEEQASHFARARARIEEALALPEERPSLSAALHRRAGCIEARTGRFAESQTHLEEALRLAEQSGNRDQVASVLNNLTSLHTVAGNMDEAEACLARAFANAQELVHSDPFGWLHSVRAFLFYAQRRLREAVTAQSEALAHWSRTGDIGAEVYGRLLRAAMLLELDAHEEARVDLVRLEQLGTSEMGCDALFLCGLVHHALGAFGRASERYQLALERQPEEAAADARAPILSMRAAAEFERNDANMARRLLEDAHPEAPRVAALVTLSRARCLGVDQVGGQEVVDKARAEIANASFTEEVIRLRVAAHLLKA